MIQRILILCLLVLSSSNVLSSGSGFEVKDIYYCGKDFSMAMSNGERWVVRMDDVGEQKLNHFLSMAIYMSATGKKTTNVFPGEEIDWCGNTNVKPITIFGFKTN